MSLTVAELKTAIEERSVKIKEGLAKKERQQDHISKIAALRERLEARKSKIIEEHEKLEDRISRQDIHVDKIINGSMKLDQHLARWTSQNERDLESIKVLESSEESPSE